MAFLSRLLLSLVFLQCLAYPAFSQSGSTSDASATPAKTTIIYYMLERISIPTANGIVAVSVGDKVTVTGETPGGMSVITEQGLKLNVTRAQMTADMAKIRAVLQQNAADETARAEAARTRRDAGEAAAVRKAALETEKRNAAMAAIATAAATPAPVHSRLTGSMLDEPSKPSGKVNKGKANKGK